MKTTINIPDDLYRMVKAKSAMEGLAVREATVNLYRAWVGAEAGGEAKPTAERWIDDWIALGKRTRRNAAKAGRTATDILAEDRGRLDRK